MQLPAGIEYYGLRFNIGQIKKLFAPFLRPHSLRSFASVIKAQYIYLNRGVYFRGTRRASGCREERPKSPQRDGTKTVGLDEKFVVELRMRDQTLRMATGRPESLFQFNLRYSFHSLLRLRLSSFVSVISLEPKKKKRDYLPVSTFSTPSTLCIELPIAPIPAAMVKPLA